MKFRTDFVTNSSSTSYISITFGYSDGGSRSVFNADYDGSSKDRFGFRIGKEDLELNVSSIEEVLEAMKAIYNTLSEDYSFSTELKSKFEKDKNKDEIETITIELADCGGSDTRYTETLFVDFKKKLLKTSTNFVDFDDFDDDYDW